MDELKFAYRGDLADPESLEDGQLGYFPRNARSAWWIKLPDTSATPVFSERRPGSVLIARENVFGKHSFTICQRFLCRIGDRVETVVLIDSEWHIVPDGGLFKEIEAS